MVGRDCALESKRHIVTGVVGVLALAYTLSILPNFLRRAEWKPVVAALQSLSHEQVETAAQAFARDRKTTDRAVPLRESVSAGYLRAEDIRGLEDRDATVSLSTDETTPQMFSRS